MGSDRVASAIVDKYRLVRLIGSGAMGSVYEAVHVAIGKRVALKLIHPAHATDPDVIARFRREAQAAARIESDYIVQCFDVGEDADHGLYMVIEYLEGEDLEQGLERLTPLDVPTAVTIGYQVARGLAKAHAAGVIHRDLKPANVFLTTRRDDDALLTKVLDFGISKLRDVDHASNDGLTEPGITLGTPQYMSPEQVQGVRPLDARTDVWSLAAVLYECLRGAPPFGERDYLEILLAITREDVPRLSEVAPWVPQTVADVVHAGLARDRDQRVPDAATFAHLLHQAHPSGHAVSGRFSVAKLRISHAQIVSNGEEGGDDALPPSSTTAHGAVLDKRLLSGFAPSVKDAPVPPPPPHVVPASPLRRR